MTDLEVFALELAKVAAEASLSHFRTDVSEINKAEPGSFDPVTEADRAAERALRAAINARYPEHGIIGEEYGEENPDADYVWILDPIDGTRAFISGLPLWTNLISLRHQGVPVIGSEVGPFLGAVIATRHCHNEEKMRMLRERGYGEIDVAYSDSSADLPLLRNSEQWCLVSPGETCLRRIEQTMMTKAQIVSWRNA